ncbi:MAG: hypothetical protein ACT4PP_10285 [Sporichthyaceae bacterium]
MGEVEADLDTLTLIAGRLHKAADSLDEAGVDAPTSVDGGELSAYLLDALSVATASAAQVAVATAALGEKLAAVVQTYRDQDDLVSEDFVRLLRRHSGAP